MGVNIILAAGALQGKALRKWDGYCIWGDLMNRFEKRETRTFSSLACQSSFYKPKLKALN